MEYFNHEVELVKLEREEISLIKFIRGLKYGSIEITVQAGKPTIVKNVIQNVKL